ncbi:MAG: hypothetical protein Q7R57_03155 [Dehalococcoidales bacterium]|nr:hypothetical protein [Dehalococcoidales bacterium]
MMKIVIRLRNDDVIVFDDAGRQMPEHQGQYQDVKDEIREHAVTETLFLRWFGYDETPELVCKALW